VIATRVGIALAREERVFCGDDEVVPVGFKEFAQQALTGALVIFVGGVGFLGFPDFPESHRAEAKLGDPKPAFS
jgi:hypothetical protein